jgi:hypothetical protein
MLGFRLFALRYWKRGVVRGYTRWRRANVLVRSNLPTPPQMVCYRMVMDHVTSGLPMVGALTGFNAVCYGAQMKVCP